jgi:hypothetical protein
MVDRRGRQRGRLSRQMDKQTDRRYRTDIADRHIDRIDRQHTELIDRQTDR